jgi:zinc transport system substrate-binding protein
MRLLILVFFSIFYFSLAQVKITATVKPLADIAKEIVKEKGSVVFLIPPNVSVHFYEYKISDIKAVYDSDIFIFIGTGEPNIKSLQKNARKEKINVSKLQNLHRIEQFEFGEEEDHHHSNSIHPAVWLDPYNAKVIAEAVYEKLLSIDPKNADFYRKNLESFNLRVDNLYKYGKKQFSSLKSRYFISYHYTWPYFVKAFDLIYLDVVELGHGREPTPKHIVNLIKKIKNYNIRTIFAAKQFYNPKYGNLLIKQTGVKIVFLDPFGENKDYIQMLKFNIDTVYKNLK